MNLFPFLQRLATDIPLVAGGAELQFLQSFDGSNPALAEHPFFKEMRDKVKPQMAVEGGVAVIPVRGLLAKAPSVWELMSGRVEDTGAITDLVERAADDPKVKGALLLVDSPGGFFMGGPELADAVGAMTRTKPVVAHVSGMGASLAYMVSSQASSVVVTRSSAVGSIGTYNVHADTTKMLESMGIKLEVFRNTGGALKAPGAMGTALTDQQREHIQAQTDRVNKVFTDMVTAKRPKVQAESMRGQVFIGQEAVTAGLADSVGTQAQALQLLHRLTA